MGTSPPGPISPCDSGMRIRPTSWTTSGGSSAGLQRDTPARFIDLPHDSWIHRFQDQGFTISDWVRSGFKTRSGAGPVAGQPHDVLAALRASRGTPSPPTRQLRRDLAGARGRSRERAEAGGATRVSVLKPHVTSSRATRSHRVPGTMRPRRAAQCCPAVVDSPTSLDARKRA
jgi:hypothetical protein